MRNIGDDLNNPYDDPKITNKRLDPYAGVVVNGLTAANGSGDYTNVIADVVNARTPFHLNLNKLGSDFAIGKGKTELVQNVMADFLEHVRNNKGMITGKYFKAHHDFYIEFYTYELEDFNNINKTTAPGLMSRYATAAHTHVADFTPAFDTESAAFETRFSNALDVQDSSKTNLGSDRSGRDSGRTALNIALFGAYNFAKYKSNCDYDFIHSTFPIETLFRHTPHNIIHLSGTIAPLATVNIAEAIYGTNDWVMLHDNGVCDLLIGLELTAETEVGTLNGKKVNKGKNKSFRITNTGNSTNHFLNITNLSLTDEATWKVDIYKKD